MLIEYGNIKKDIVWKWPTEEIFNSWKEDFFKLEDSKFFDIYLIGGFLEKLENKREYTQDIDIILTNNNDLSKIERLINEGTRLGLEKYNVFFDVLWLDSLPVYSDMKLNDVQKVKAYVHSNKWIVDGVVKKQYSNAKKIKENLWEIESIFPTQKQKKILETGYVYSRPLKINK